MTANMTKRSFSVRTRFFLPAITPCRPKNAATEDSNAIGFAGPVMLEETSSISVRMTGFLKFSRYSSQFYCHTEGGTQLGSLGWRATKPG